MLGKKDTQENSVKTKAALTVKVLPRSPKTGIAGFMEDGTVKIRLNAPPVEGKANEALIHFLADVLSVKRSAVEIITGQTSRLKTIKIEGVTQEYVERMLHEQKT